MAINRRIIIDSVCGWPNLTKLNDGRLITTVFNKPSHLCLEGELDCYISDDEGETWQFLSNPIFHEERTARANCACGITANNSFLVICGGWDKRPKPGESIPKWIECNRLPAVLCRSKDNGKTYEHKDFTYSIPNMPTPAEALINVYGDIIRVGNRLAVAGYTCNQSMTYTRSYILFSEDDGENWTSHHSIEENNHHETTLLFMDDKYGIAISRENSENRLDQYTTYDGGIKWSFTKAVTGPGVHPGHLVLLKDGTVVLTVGIRYKNGYGVGAVQSRDKGKTWSRMTVLTSYPEATDGGYPSTVQLKSGRLLTHYYANKSVEIDHYHVGQIIWDISELND